MKRNLTLGLLLLAVHFINANPYPVPTNFVLSELVFDSEGKWTIELKILDHYYYNEYTDFRTEEIFITSLSGQSNLKQLNNESIRKTLIVKITNDSLQSDLT
ncbi:MAG TPA: hypothetical protein P5084_01670, partial [Paludibacter sp.]|nr:hypothetical protein [Paludibacter sp.]